MASSSSSSVPLFLFSLFFITTECFASFVIPVTKDASTHQYTAELFLGTNLVVDLGGKSLWVACDSSQSHHSSIPSASLHCSLAKSASPPQKIHHHTKTKTKIKTKTTSCEIHIENTITGVATSGDLAEVTLTVDSYEDGVITLFSCAPKDLLEGLATGAKGMLGLGRSKISLPSQISTSFGFHHRGGRKFALCLSSDGGFIVSGLDLSKSLTYTPLVSVHGDGNYYVHVNSIRVNGRKVSLGRRVIGAAEISTVVPYTTMESTVYEKFTRAYVKAAAAAAAAAGASMNLTRVAPVAPFGACFSSKEVGIIRTPYVDLVLQSEMVKWRIQGGNLMVQVTDEVMCLGLLDGGSSAKSSIVIGGYQLEDNILEFDLGSSMLGFGSSLLMGSSGCSSLRSVSTPRESL